MTTQSVLNWWNLIFLAPFAMALLYLGVYTLSGWTFGDVDADAEVEAETDVAFEQDVDAEADADADAEVQAHHDLHVEPPHEASGLGSAVWNTLSFLGVGRVPVSIVLMVLLLTWGAIGFAVNRVAADHVAEPWQVALYSLPAALIGSLLLTSGTSRAINRFMPLNVSLARRRHELLGASAEVVLPVDGKFGMAIVRDNGGDLYQIPCRLELGSETIPKGARVKLVAYSARESLFYVLPEVPAGAA